MDENFRRKIQRFAEVLHAEQRTKIAERFKALNADEEAHVKVHYGSKYVRMDVGSSGKYMVDFEGRIFGIKAYGVPNKKKQYGTLDTIEEWHWGEYTASRRAL